MLLRQANQPFQFGIDPSCDGDQVQKAESIQQPKLAWQLRKHYLGSDLPKTKEVENMIKAAQGG